MFCINCGKQIGDDARFCPSCGAKIEPAEAFPSASAETPAMLSGDEQTVYLSDSDNNAYENGFTGDGKTTIIHEDELDGASDISASTDDFSFGSTDDYTAPPVDDLFSSEPVSSPEPAADVADPFAEPEYEEIPMKPRSEHGVLSSNIPLTGHHSAFSSPNDDLLDDEPAPISAPEPELPEPDYSDIFGGQTVVTSEEPAAPVSEPEPAPAPAPDPFGTVYAGSEPEESAPLSGNTDSYDTINIPAQSLYGEAQTPPPPAAPVFGDYQRNDAPPPPPPQQPYPGEPVPAPQPAYAEAAPAKKKKVSGGRLFFASILTFFAVIFLLVLSLLVSVKFGASGKALESRINKLDENTILSAKTDDDEVSDSIYKTIKFRSATNGAADKKQFKEYLSKSNMLDFAAGNVKKYADYIIEGKGKDPSVSSEDIKVDFFKANNGVANEVFGHELTKKELESLQKQMEKNDVDKNLSVKEWNKHTGFDLKNAKYAFSYVTLGVLGAIVLVFLICIALVVERRGRHVAGFFSSVFFFSGIITFICGLGTIAGSSVIYAVTSNIIFYLIPNVLLWFGVWALAIGFGELLLSGLFKMIKNSLKRKERAKLEREKVLAEANAPVYA